MSKEEPKSLLYEFLSSFGMGISIIGWIWFGVAMYLRCIDATVYATNNRGLVDAIQKTVNEYEPPESEKGKLRFLLIVNPKESEG